METKTCSRCDQEKPITDFHRDGKEKSGYKSHCKVCAGAYRHAHYQENKRRVDRQNKRYRKHHQDRYRTWRQTDKRRHPEQIKARLAVYGAVRSGSLPPVSTLPCACPGCTSGANEYHHWSYAPADHLSVIPLCFSHHRLIHSGGIALEQPERYAIQPEGAL